MKENEIAKNLMLGHSCDDCDHRSFGPWQAERQCKRKGKKRPLPKENICSFWSRDFSLWGNRLKPSHVAKLHLEGKSCDTCFYLGTHRWGEACMRGTRYWATSAFSPVSNKAPSPLPKERTCIRWRSHWNLHALPNSILKERRVTHAQMARLDGVISLEKTRNDLKRIPVKNGVSGERGNDGRWSSQESIAG